MSHLQRVSTGNSTTTPLAANAVFAGSSENVLSFAFISAIVSADAGGVLEFQFSTNGTDWDHSKKHLVAANTSVTIKQEVHGNHGRVLYRNGRHAQSSFRLQTTLTGQSHTGSHTANLRGQEGALAEILATGTSTEALQVGSGGSLDFFVQTDGTEDVLCQVQTSPTGITWFPTMHAFTVPSTAAAVASQQHYSMETTAAYVRLLLIPTDDCTAWASASTL